MCKGMGIPPIHLRPISFLGLGMRVTSEPRAHVFPGVDGRTTDEEEGCDFITGVGCCCCVVIALLIYCVNVFDCWAMSSGLFRPP